MTITHEVVDIFVEKYQTWHGYNLTNGLWSQALHTSPTRANNAYNKHFPNIKVVV